MADALALLTRAGSLYHGKLPAYTEWGAYQLIYTTDQCALLCRDCATTEYFDWLYSLNTCDGWEYDPPTSVDVYYEGPDEICDNCNAHIPSAYGNPWEENDNE